MIFNHLLKYFTSFNSQQCNLLLEHVCGIDFTCRARQHIQKDNDDENRRKRINRALRDFPCPRPSPCPIPTPRRTRWSTRSCRPSSHFHRRHNRRRNRHPRSKARTSVRFLDIALTQHCLSGRCISSVQCSNQPPNTFSLSSEGYSRGREAEKL